MEAYDSLQKSILKEHLLGYCIIFLNLHVESLVGLNSAPLHFLNVQIKHWN